MKGGKIIELKFDDKDFKPGSYVTVEHIFNCLDESFANGAYTPLVHTYIRPAQLKEVLVGKVLDKKHIKLLTSYSKVYRNRKAWNEYEGGAKILEKPYDRFEIIESISWFEMVKIKITKLWK